MTWGAVAVGVGGIAAGLISSNKQSNAAKSAANAQANAADQASQTELQMYNQNRADQAPFRTAGLTALQQYMSMLGLPTNGTDQYGGQTGFGAQDMSDTGAAAAAYLKANPDVAANPYFSTHPLEHYQQYGMAEGRTWGATPTAGTSTVSTNPQQAQQDAFAAFRATPGYQFGLDQGTKAVQASAAARGGLNSGATLKALQEFGNNYADQQGYTPYMNKLASLAGMAQTSTNTTGQQGTQVAGQIGNNTISGGQARAGGIYGSANAWSNGVNQIAQGVGYMNGQGVFNGLGGSSSSLGGTGSSYSGINDGSIGNWNGSLV